MNDTVAELDSLSPSYVRRKIEADIAALELQLADLKQAWNQHCTILCLPVELLAKVLRYVHATPVDRPPTGERSKIPKAVLEADERKNPFWRSYNKEWLQARLVCRGLNDIAKNTPQLWSFIDGRIANLDWIRLCVKRSRNISLVINSPQWGHYDDGSPAMFASEYLQYASAAKLLSTSSAQDPRYNVAFHEAIDQPAPRMEFFQCSGSSSFTITDNFLGGSCHILRKLILRDSRIGEDTPEFPALEHLELRNVYVGLQLDVLFCLLRKCPKLLVLSLESLEHFSSDGMVQPADANDTTSKYSSVSFPKLHVLQIIEDLPTSLAIIRLLGIPRKALVMRTRPSFLRGGKYLRLPCNEKEWKEVLQYIVDFKRAHMSERPQDIVFMAELRSNTSCTWSMRIGSALPYVHIPMEAQLLLETECLVQGHDDLLSNATVLHFLCSPSDFYSPDVIGFQIKLYGTSFMPALQRVVLDSARSCDIIRGFLDYIKTRAQQGGQVLVVEFLKCFLEHGFDSELAQQWKDLADSGMVGRIIWPEYQEWLKRYHPI